ncbi:tetratricopeptide repeat-containing sensor histidine kinase [Psychroserpens sp. NJDZ02]|uniref:tetratricopeptide repeat-containing sensor histidine kinase n=1 Tax=Psychroserpens sp. NJDZ02 TaxID=2570561 RepID=UPI0010A85247|nr:tetratricopeptide repeat-containing sensor histidine kinase [Psychroserpens sp. NJDZ02]QCE42588.1 ATP-binding protein [Psychroserpens sp. NJDZ02]
MKLFKYSFLFFVFFMVYKTSFSQQTKDSTAYYVDIIEHVKSSDDLVKAFQFFQNDLKKELNKNNIKRVAYDLLHISIIEYKVGFYYESEVSVVKAIGLIDNEKKVDSYYLRLKAILYNRLGILYKEQRNTTKAIETYKTSFALAETARDSMTLYNNISNVLKEDKQFEKAELELLKAYSLFDRVNDSTEKARVLDNLGFVKFKLNKPEGYLFMLEGLEIRELLNNNYNLYASYSHLSNYYKEKKDYNTAKAFALEAFDIANTIKSASYREDALKLRVNLKDYSVFEAYLRLSDSIKLARQTNLNKFASMKYDYSKSELKSQKEKTKKQQYQFIVVLLSVIGLSLFFLLKIKHRKEKLLEIYTTETRISKKVHDEVANDVYQVMTKLQGDIIVKEDVLDDLEQIYTKTRDISKENSAIDVAQDFKELLTDLLLSYKSDQVNVVTKGLSVIEWEVLSDIKKTTVYRILQELMTNMKKHSEATIVVLIFIQKNKKIEISYKDNGVGSVLKKQNGLQNVENRIQSINGTITFDSEINQGFKAFFIV